MEIQALNVNHMLVEALWRMKSLHVETETRNGKAFVVPEPVIMTYLNPWQRVLFSPVRDANPIFHLMECLWILAGRNDVGFLSQFNSNIKNYSDDGLTFNAGYGYRLRSNFGFDQLRIAVIELMSDPTSRRTVIQLWDAHDLGKPTKDKACNLSIAFLIDQKGLNMTVFNRSNDLWWGACGANAVHFSFIQELVAAALDVPIGRYYQITNNLHLYADLYDGREFMNYPTLLENEHMYEYPLEHYPILSGTSYSVFISECEQFCRSPFTSVAYYSDFLRDVAYPMAMVTQARRQGGDALEWCERIKADDWRMATTQWVNRRAPAA